MCVVCVVCVVCRVMAMCDPAPAVMSHSNIPFCSLGISTRHLLARRLNPKRDDLSPHTLRLQDWRGLAEVFGFTQLDVDNFDLRDNPTVEVLTAWLRQNPQSTIGDFVRALLEIERYDILHCDTIQAAIGKTAVDNFRLLKVLRTGFLANVLGLRPKVGSNGRTMSIAGYLPKEKNRIIGLLSTRTRIIVLQ